MTSNTLLWTCGSPFLNLAYLLKKSTRLSSWRQSSVVTVWISIEKRNGTFQNKGKEVTFREETFNSEQVFNLYFRLRTIAFLTPTLILKLETEHLAILFALALFFGWSQVTFHASQHPKLAMYQNVFSESVLCIILLLRRFCSEFVCGLRRKSAGPS